MERTQFTFYESFYKAVARMKKKTDQADTYNAIIRLALYGEEPDLENLSDMAAVALENIIPNILASNRKAENGMKGGKQNGSKPEAKRKQNASEKENEKENEIEIENECYNPLTPFEGELKQAVSEWLQYKKEKREAYKPTGLKGILTQIRNKANLYGDQAVVDAIHDAMANNYKGIAWYSLEKKDRPKAGRMDFLLKSIEEDMKRERAGNETVYLLDGSAVV